MGGNFDEVGLALLKSAVLGTACPIVSEKEDSAPSKNLFQLQLCQFNVNVLVIIVENFDDSAGSFVFRLDGPRGG